MSKVNRISANDLSAMATQSIDRALEARKIAGIEELNLDEINAVSGALSFRIIFAGGPFINPMLNQQLKGFNINTNQVF